MEKKRSVGVTVVGRVNIIFGSIFLICLAIPVFLVAIVGWTADRGADNFLDWLTLFFLNRIFLGIFYFSIFLLIWAGFAAIKIKPNTIRLNLIASSLMFSSGLISVFLFFVNNIIQPRLGIDFAMEKLLDIRENHMFYIPCAYAIFLIIYFTRPKVKEQFK